MFFNLPQIKPWFCCRLAVVLFTGLAGGARADFIATNSADTAWSLHVWQSDDGLPNNNVTSLAQTRDGYLWVATAGHFARFDGVQFEEFTAKNIITNYTGNSERGGAILKDSKGGLWMTMIHGPVVRMASSTAQTFTNKLPDYIVLGMLEDGEGAIWIAYHGNVVCRIKNGEVSRVGEAEGLPARFDCVLTKDKSGRVWFAKDGQTGFFENGRFQILNKTLGRNVRIAGASSGGIWICSGHELFKCDDAGTLTSAGIFKTDAPASDPTCLLEDRSGAVWIGTTASGLFRYDGSRFENIPTSHPYISSLLQDNEGDLWAGTSGGGLNRIRPRAFTMEDKTTGLPFGEMKSICEDTEGSIWVTTLSGQLACRKNGNWRIVSDETNWPSVKATCLTAGRRMGSTAMSFAAW